MRTGRWIALLALALAVAGSDGFAAADRYGAIAAASDGRYGYSFDHVSRGAAEAFALSKCGHGGCVVKVWFKNNCGAYARGRNGEGWAYAETRAAAQRRALAECAAQTRSCAILCWACNGQ